MASVILSRILASNMLKLKPMFAYLKPHALESPKLTYQHEAIIPIEQALLSITQLKQEIERRWILTLTDENKGGGNKKAQTHRSTSVSFNYKIKRLLILSVVFSKIIIQHQQMSCAPTKMGCF